MKTLTPGIQRLVRACPAHAGAIGRLDHALEKHAGHSNAELIRLMRRSFLADGDEVEESVRQKLLSLRQHPPNRL